MHTAYYNEYSYHLDRMMGFKVYGHAGRPCLVFPAQSGRFYDFENFGMVGAVQDLLEQGRLQLFTCDSIDWPMPATSWKNWRRGSSRLTSGPTTAGGPAGF